ncbi:MAG: hypothetical protein MHM6MM_003920 [Cercozoa sp. M6MM]
MPKQHAIRSYTVAAAALVCAGVGVGVWMATWRRRTSVCTGRGSDEELPLCPEDTSKPNTQMVDWSALLQRELQPHRKRRELLDKPLDRSNRVSAERSLDALDQLHTARMVRTRASREERRRLMRQRRWRSDPVPQLAKKKADVEEQGEASETKESKPKLRRQHSDSGALALLSCLDDLDDEVVVSG